jgi:hypothetical protein
MQTERVLNGMAGFVSKQSYAFGLGSPLDLENLGAFEPLQSGVGKVERDRDPRNAIGRKPFFREPAVGSDAQISRLEFEIEPLDRIFEPAALEFDPEVAEAPVEKFPSRIFLPGMNAWHGPDSIPRGKPAS